MNADLSVVSVSSCSKKLFLCDLCVSFVPFVVKTASQYALRSFRHRVCSPVAIKRGIDGGNHRVEIHDSFQKLADALSLDDRFVDERFVVDSQHFHVPLLGQPGIESIQMRLKRRSHLLARRRGAAEPLEHLFL